MLLRKRSQTAYKIVKIQLDHPVLIKVCTITHSNVSKTIVMPGG